MSDSERPADAIGETNVCLEFHNPDYQREIGADFDPEAFADRLDAANVDSILFEAKCHHGYCYYDTDAGTRHPHLDEDLIAAVHEACHERDISIHTYVTLVWNNLDGRDNPDWLQHDADGEPLAATERDEPWDWLCLNSPYTDEVLYPTIRELLEGYDIDALFFDILFYHPDACTCRYCRQTMAAEGLDPEDPADRKRHRTRLIRRFAERTTDLVKRYDESVAVTYNHPTAPGITSALEPHMDFLLIESLPAHGWGYLHQPQLARYTRNFDSPVQGMTGIAHSGWAEFGTCKNETQLAYELALSASHHFHLSVGDPVGPRLSLDADRYDVIESAFGSVKALDLPPAEPARDVAVLGTGDDDAVHPASDGEDLGPSRDGLAGATKFLLDTHQQFDVLDERLARDMLGDAGFSVLVAPDIGALEDTTAEAVRSFVGDGGSLIATGSSSLDDGAFALADVFGARYRGRLPYSAGYIDLDRYGEGVPTQPCFSYSGFSSVTPMAGARKATVVAPTTERSATRRFSHKQAPPERELDAPAIVRNEFGDGESIYIATDLFAQYYAEDYHGHRTLLDNAVASLQSDRLVSTDAPLRTEVNVMEADDARYVHLTTIDAYRAGDSMPRLDDVEPVSDVSLRVYSPDRSTVTTVSNTTVTVERNGEHLDLTLDEVTVHECVAIK